MEQKRKLMENAKEVKLNDWLMHMCDTATIENDIAFINAFNRRFKRFKELFIDND